MIKALTKLHNEIRHLTDTEVTFHNGCWISLLPEGSMYFGTNPYGIDWFCDASRFDTALPTWIHFWNQHRDENSKLIQFSKIAKTNCS